MTLKSISRAIALLIFVLWQSSAVVAQERILDFQSRVNVQPDGSYIVTETIKVRAERKKIRRGIYRDFPLRFEGRSGAENLVGFELLSATRDGKKENTRVEKSSRALRIYLGKSSVFLNPGIYTYELRYRTDRQLRRFDDRVEVYWNATGNFWDFPIDSATAMIDLPDGATADKVAFFTGRFGSTAKNAKSTLLSDGNVVRVTTTRRLAANEGLTVAVSFGKQFVDAPDASDELRWFFRDHAAAIISFGGAILAFVYYLWAWARVGRNPPEGVMVPRWDVPEEVSPALVNYIDNRGLEGRGFRAISAALLNLAVKGLVTLEEIGNSVIVRSKVEDVPDDLPRGERTALSRVLAAGGELKIAKSNGSKVKSLVNSFGRAMNGEHRNVFYKANYLYLLPGAAVSMVALILALILGSGASAGFGAVIPVVFGIGVFGAFAIDFAHRIRSGGLGSKIQAVFIAFILIFMFNAVGANFLDALPQLSGQWLLAGGLAALVIVNILFFILMGAPTPLGRKRMDEIAGLKRYLTVAEKDRMNMRGAPQMSPAHYETLLPYAVALGVEKPWSKAFQSWLATAAVAGGAAGIAYHGPSWYDGGSGFDADTIGDRMSGIGTDIANSLTSSMPAPKSSSSGFSSGGGFSGGGGGGGGGGGW